MNKIFQFFTPLIFFFVIGMIIVFREPVLYINSEFWAEDCIDFFTTANSKGFKSLFIPIWGYHFFLGRFIAYGATFFPVLFSPTIYIFSALFINTITLSYFTRSGFSWLVSSRIIRFIVCILMATGPGYEVYRGLCVMYSPLVLLGFLLLLERPWNPDLKKIFIFVILTFSTGVMFSAIPFILYIYYQTRKKGYLVILTIIIFASIYNVIGTTSADSLAVQTGEFKINNLLSIPEIILKNFVFRLFFIPFFGQINSEALQSPSKIFLLFFSLIIFAYIFIKYHFYKDKRIHILILIYSSFIGIMGVTALVRNSGMEILLMKASLNWGTRYFFLPGVWAILFWCYITTIHQNGKNALNFSLIIYIMASINILNWKPLFYRENFNWKASAEKIQNAIDTSNQASRDYTEIIKFTVHPNVACTFATNPSMMLGR